MSEENKNTESEQSAESIPKEIIPSEEIMLPEAEVGESEQPQTTSNENILPEQEQGQTPLIHETKTPATQQPQSSNLSSGASAKVDTKPETTDMEVHHHTHPSHHKKRWTDYFWEFLMLFLAVFCGFLAEYQLEHTIEHQREKQYVQSMLSDLSADTATINTAIPSKEARARAIDSVFMFFNANPKAKTIAGKLFKTIRRTNFDFRFIRSNITLNQLKNAGGMRLIRNKQVADSISAYDIYCESTISLYNELYLISSQTGARQFESLFTATDLLPLYIENNTGRIVANIPDSLVVRINSAGLNEQLNFMMQEKSYALQEIDRYLRVKQKAKQLMELIKKEYPLE